jgi:hypothetical protein
MLETMILKNILEFGNFILHFIVGVPHEKNKAPATTVPSDLMVYRKMLLCAVPVLEVRPSLLALYQTLTIRICTTGGNMTGGKNRNAQRKNCPSATFSSTNYTWTELKCVSNSRATCRERELRTARTGAACNKSALP